MRGRRPRTAGAPNEIDAKSANLMHGDRSDSEGAGQRDEARPAEVACRDGRSGRRALTRERGANCRQWSRSVAPLRCGEKERPSGRGWRCSGSIYRRCLAFSGAQACRESTQSRPSRLLWIAPKPPTFTFSERRWAGRPMTTRLEVRTLSTPRRNGAGRAERGEGVLGKHHPGEQPHPAP